MLTLGIAIFIVLVFHFIFQREAYQFVNRNSSEKVRGSAASNLTMIGAGSILLVSIVHMVFPFIGEASNLITNKLLTILYTSFVRAALLEELCKYAVFLWLLYSIFNNTKNYYHIIYSSIIVALGFATVENALYVMGVMGSATSPIMLAIHRGFLCTAGHMVSGLFIGIYAAKGFSSENWQQFIKYNAIGVLLAIVTHGLWNSFVSLGIMIIPVLSLWGMYQLSQKIMRDTHKEIPEKYKEYEARED